MQTKSYNLIAPEDLGKNTTIDLQVCENEVDMYWRIAIEVLETVVENNKKNEPTSDVTIDVSIFANSRQNSSCPV